MKSGRFSRQRWWFSRCEAAARLAARLHYKICRSSQGLPPADSRAEFSQYENFHPISNELRHRQVISCVRARQGLGKEGLPKSGLVNFIDSSLISVEGSAPSHGPDTNSFVTGRFGRQLLEHGRGSSKDGREAPEELKNLAGRISLANPSRWL
jgi:hypothetical protein